MAWPPQRGGRLAALDGLRGLAAAVVVVRHAFNSVDLPLDVARAVLHSPLALLLNGQGAVQLFFVLSGFVLAPSLGRDGWPRATPRFWLRRLFRIQPPYAFALLFAWGASALYRAPSAGDGVTRWAAQYLSVRLDLPAVLSVLAIPSAAFGLLPPGWTLTVESLFSLLFPALLLVARRGHWSLLVGATVLLLLAPVPKLLWYGLDFALGIALFAERERLARAFAAAGPVLRGLVLAASLLLFSAPVAFGGTPLASGVILSGFAPGEIALLGAGSAGLVACALFSPGPRRLLAARPCVFLGRVSYSLYLLHFPVLLVMLGVFPGRLGLASIPLLAGVVLAVSVPLAALAYAAVERPAIRVGAALGRRLEGR